MKAQPHLEPDWPTPPWVSDGPESQRRYERLLKLMRRFEAEAIACGFEVRPKQKHS